MQVPVACTPNGLADAATPLSDDAHASSSSSSHTGAMHQASTKPNTKQATRQSKLCFALPHEQTVTMGKLAAHIAAAAAQGCSAAAHESPILHDDIWYLQPQNNSLTTLFAPDVQALFCHPNLCAWGTHIFGAPPDASNIWVGDPRSRTSFHKDHYENLYHVLHGTKRFVLYPPCDVWRMGLTQLPVAQWKHGGVAHQSGVGGYTLHVLPDTPPVVWSVLAVDDKPDDNSAHSTEYDPPPPFIAMVHAGEVLYLPSLWFHAVSHVPCAACTDSDVIAVNYWFDMQYDLKFAYFKALERAVCGQGAGDE